MTVLLCEHDDDDDDHDTTRFRAVRRRNVTTPTTAEINSEESLYRFVANEGSTKRTRKCIAACVRTNKGDRYTGAADTATMSHCCNDAVQKTYRPAQQHDRSTACNKKTTDCRGGQCPRTGKYVANDNTQCTGTRSHRANEGPCTITDAKYGATDNTQCTGTRGYRSNDGQYTGAATGNYGTNNNRCTDTGNYRANDCQSTGTGNYGTKNNGCNGCGCISAAAACLGGENAPGRGNPNTLVSTIYKWARVAKDWTLDKSSYFLVAVVSFILGIYTCDLGLCTCEDVSC